MNRKLLFFIVAFACLAGTAKAQNFLTLYARSGLPTQSWEANKVRSITFSSAGVNFWMKQGGAPDVYPYSAARRLIFGDEDPIAVKSVQVQRQALSYDAAVHAVTVGDFSQGAMLHAYTVGGRRVWSAPVCAPQTAYSLPPLAAGVYIVRLSGSGSSQTLKIQVK